MRRDACPEGHNQRETEAMIEKNSVGEKEGHSLEDDFRAPRGSSFMLVFFSDTFLPRNLGGRCHPT